MSMALSWSPPRGFVAQRVCFWRTICSHGETQAGWVVGAIPAANTDQASAPAAQGAAGPPSSAAELQECGTEGCSDGHRGLERWILHPEGLRGSVAVTWQCVFKACCVGAGVGLAVSLCLMLYEEGKVTFVATTCGWLG